MMSIFDQVWPKLIGAKYAALLRPCTSQLLRSIALSLVGIVIIIGGLAIWPNAIGIALTAATIVIVLVSRWRALKAIDEVGHRIKNDLAARGITVDRRAPLTSPRLYERWLARNELTIADVADDAG